MKKLFLLFFVIAGITLLGFDTSETVTATEEPSNNIGSLFVNDLLDSPIESINFVTVDSAPIICVCEVTVPPGGIIELMNTGPNRCRCCGRILPPGIQNILTPDGS